MLNPKIICENTIFLRQQQNMTQQELAARVNVTHQAVSKWENGSSIPDLQTLMTLSRLFNVSLDELLTEVLSQRRPAPESAAPTEPTDQPVKSTAPVESTDQPAEPTAPAEPDAQPASAPIDIKMLVKMTPLMGRSELGRTVLSSLTAKTCAESVDLRTLTSLAPFVSRDALAELLSRLDPAQIDLHALAGIAPFVSRDALAELVKKTSAGRFRVTINNDDSAHDDRDAPDSIRDAIDNCDWNYIEDHIADMTPAEERAAALAAAGDGYLDFMPALSLDQEMLDQVARLGAENGDVDDVFEFLSWNRLSPDAQNAVIDTALNSGNGDELLEHRRKLTAEQLAHIALSLTENGDFDELEDVFSDLTDNVRARIVRMAIDADDLDFIAPFARRLAPADQEKIAVHWAEEEEWDELTCHINLAVLGKGVLRRLIDLADEQEERSIARRLRALLGQAAAPSVSADELLERARTGDFAPLSDALPPLNDTQWDELVCLVIVHDAFDALAPHAAEIPPQPHETLCYALARLGDMERLAVFFPNPSANPALAQRLNRIVENNG